MSCGLCKNFRLLKDGSYFGKCIRGVSDKDIFNNSISQVFGGKITEIPIVHKEDIYSCFEQ